MSPGVPTIREPVSGGFRHFGIANWRDPQLITETSNETPPLTGRAVKHRKLRVDRCHQLDLAAIHRRSLLSRPGCVWHSRQDLGWTHSSSVYGFLISEMTEPLCLVLFDELSSDALNRAYGICLEWTPCHFGGRRWWFRCPLSRDGVPCGRRCRVVYRPAGAEFFGCRECHRLTYRSRQQHRNRWWEGFARPLQLLEQDERRSRRRGSPRQQQRRLDRLQRASGAMRNFTESLQKRVERSGAPAGVRKPAMWP